MTNNYCHLSYKDRKNIEDGLNNNKSIYAISKLLNRSYSSIYREIDRNKVYYKPNNHNFIIILIQKTYINMNIVLN